MRVTALLQNKHNKRLLALLIVFIVAVMTASFLNLQMDDEIHTGFYDYEGYPQNASFENGVVTVDETTGLSEGDLIARIPKIHVDSGEYILDIDHQNDSDFDAVIFDGDKELYRVVLPSTETNTKYRFGSSKNLYNLRIDLLYNGKGSVTVKKSTLYSVGRPFYYDTVLFAIVMILAAVIITLLLMKINFFSLPSEDRLFWGVLILFLVFINYPFYRPFDTGAGGDIGYHITRIEGIYQGLKQGQVPPVLYTDAMHGRGMIGALYPYLFCIIPALLRVCHISIEGAFRVWFIMINTASCCTAYYAAKKMTGRSRLALITMILYGLLPYRITTLTWRYAYGEALTFIFIPLVLAGMHGIISGEKKRWPLLSIGLSGIILSHIVTSLQIAVLCILTGVLFLPKLIKDRRIHYVLYSIIACALMTLWFTVPFLYYYDSNIDLGVQTAGDLPYITYFASQMMQLLPNNTPGTQLFHQVETMGVWLILLVVFAGIIQLAKRERGSEDDLAAVFMVIGGIYLFGATKTFPWQTLEKFEKIYSLATLLEFPTRLYLMGQSLLLFGSVIALRDWKPDPEKLRRGMFLGIISVAVLQGYLITDSYLTRLTPFIDVRANRYTADIADMIVYDFYAPYGYDNEDDFYDITSPGADISGYLHDGINTEFDYISDKDTYAVMPVAYYYGYRACDTDHHRELEISGTDKGYIRVELPSSESASHVEVDFKGYRYSIPLILISLGSFLGLILIMVWPYVGFRKGQEEEASKG